MSTVGGNVHSDAPRAARKAVAGVTSTAFCHRSSGVDLLAAYLKLPQTRESSRLWRKKADLSLPLSPLPIAHSILVFSPPSAAMVFGADEEHRQDPQATWAQPMCLGHCTSRLMWVWSEPDAKRKTGFTPHTAFL